MNHPTPQKILKDLWELVQGDPKALSAIQFQGEEATYPSSFQVAIAAQSVIGAAALAANEIWFSKSNQRQNIGVERKHAAIEFRSERYFQVNQESPASLWDELAGIYRVANEQFVRVHTNYPHHRENLLKLLKCAGTRESVQTELLKWNAFDFEAKANTNGCVVAAMRTREEWIKHPQAKALDSLPLFTIEKIGEAPPKPFLLGPRPLSGVRVLDLSRVIAGPVGARTLAAHGADVLRVHSPNLPAQEWLDRDTGRGKRSIFLDLKNETDSETLRQLVKVADVFMQAYRPDALAHLGFSPSELAQLQPGIVCVSLSAYGNVGPWEKFRGFDSLVQTAIGLNAAEAKAFHLPTPKELPCQALDHASGYLMAFAGMMARLKQSREGGSYLVRLSLAQTGNWLWSLGQNFENLNRTDPEVDELAEFKENTDSVYGKITAIAHSAKFSETNAHWDRPPAPLGSDTPQWLPNPL